MTQFEMPDSRGIISFLAILIMLFGAVLGSFVMGMGSQQRIEDSAPNSHIEFAWDGAETVTVQHTGGEPLDASAIEIRSPGTVSEWPGEDVIAGDEITVTGLESGDTVRVVWQSPDSDASALLASYDVP